MPEPPPLITRSDFPGGGFTIYIDGLCHLMLDDEQWVALHSYIEDMIGEARLARPRYFISIHLRTGPPILLEYDTRAKWSTILNLLRP